MMMPDMATEQAECCCGSDHRMPDPPEFSHGDHADPDYGNTQNIDSKICDDPLRKCCIVEISVGINDPPADEPGGIASTNSNNTNSTSIKIPLKIVKLLDYPFSVSDPAALTELFSLQVPRRIERPPDPNLRVSATPLYKATERYRI